VPWSVDGWIVALTGSTYLMAGFAREQVCLYMCPYARFQSAMFDKNTLIIGYDEKRGEPRGHHKKGDPWEGRGHCIDCTRCVQVCPMGIDIRKGLQMECIACGLCVDACNEVMDKIDLPRGLIRYDSSRNIAAPAEQKKFNIIRPRTIYYMLIMAVVGGLMIMSLGLRTPMELNVLHDRNPLFVTLSDGHVRNGYTIKILNKTHDDKTYTLKVAGLPGAAVVIHGSGDVVLKDISVFADSVGEYRIFVSAPPQADPRMSIRFVAKDAQSQASTTCDTLFIGGK
jgi:cytochrome c oxidase accessory protein FixG